MINADFGTGVINWIQLEFSNFANPAINFIAHYVEITKVINVLPSFRKSGFLIDFWGGLVSL